jgi:hypothetical protein
MVVGLVEQDLTRFTVIFGNRYHLHFHRAKYTRKLNLRFGDTVSGSRKRSIMRNRLSVLRATPKISVR